MTIQDLPGDIAVELEIELEISPELPEEDGSNPESTPANKIPDISDNNPIYSKTYDDVSVFSKSELKEQCFNLEK